MTVFGQLVIGAPGAGKSTYCEGMRQYMGALGRDVAVVNLDPANDEPPYEPAIDLRDLVELSAVMAEFGLGPNGGLVYCLDVLGKPLADCTVTAENKLWWPHCEVPQPATRGRHRVR